MPCTNDTGVPATGAQPVESGLVVTGTIDPAGAVGLWQPDGTRAGRLVGSDASVLLAGVSVGAE